MGFEKHTMGSVVAILMDCEEADCGPRKNKVFSGAVLGWLTKNCTVADITWRQNLS